MPVTRVNQFYKTKICPWYFKGKCERNSACRFAHSEYEKRHLPDLSCTSLCPSIVKNGVCKNENCRFAHQLEELRATDIFYKTSLCYMFIKNKCRAGAQCRHAHGIQELKAMPNSEKIDGRVHEILFTDKNEPKGQYSNGSEVQAKMLNNNKQSNQLNKKKKKTDKINRRMYSKRGDILSQGSELNYNTILTYPSQSQCESHDSIYGSSSYDSSEAIFNNQQLFLTNKQPLDTLDVSDIKSDALLQYKELLIKLSEKSMSMFHPDINDIQTLCSNITQNGMNQTLESSPQYTLENNLTNALNFDSSWSFGGSPESAFLSDNLENKHISFYPDISSDFKLSQELLEEARKYGFDQSISESTISPDSELNLNYVIQDMANDYEKCKYTKNFNNSICPSKLSQNSTTNMSVKTNNSGNNSIKYFMTKDTSLNNFIHDPPQIHTHSLNSPLKYCQEDEAYKKIEAKLKLVCQLLNEPQNKSEKLSSHPFDDFDTNFGPNLLDISNQLLIHQIPQVSEYSTNNHTYPKHDLLCISGDEHFKDPVHNFTTETTASTTRVGTPVNSHITYKNNNDYLHRKQTDCIDISLQPNHTLDFLCSKESNIDLSNTISCTIEDLPKD